ncbi:MAG: hypothetical protein Q4A17_06525 [Thermoguttaceae bacterium]|nr:hypothetical protein [Thermoguttaceae bacterium]
MKEKKIKAIFLIEPSLKARAEQKAEEEGLSFAALIRKLLSEYVGGDLTIEDEIKDIKEQLTGINALISQVSGIPESEMRRLYCKCADTSKLIIKPDNELARKLLATFEENARKIREEYTKEEEQ